jgi:hypothetical protein
MFKRVEVNMDARGDIIEPLRRVRSRLQSGARDKADPTRLFSDVKADVDLVHANMAGVRDMAPAVGELWDTLAEIIALCGELFHQNKSLRNQASDEGLQPSVPAGSE